MGASRYMRGPPARLEALPAATEAAGIDHSLRGIGFGRTGSFPRIQDTEPNGSTRAGSGTIGGGGHPNGPVDGSWMSSWCGNLRRGTRSGAWSYMT